MYIVWLKNQRQKIRNETNVITNNDVDDDDGGIQVERREFWMRSRFVEFSLSKKKMKNICICRRFVCPDCPCMCAVPCICMCVRVCTRAIECVSKCVRALLPNIINVH